MKKIFLITFLVIAVFSLKAQEEIAVKFTSTTQIGAYCPFDVVNVSNLSRGWDEVLYYPDTTLSLACSVDVSERIEISPITVHPNPFSNSTNASFSLETAAKVKIQLFQLNGRKIASYVNDFESGEVQIRVTMSEPQMALLAITTAKSRQVAKILNIGNGNYNGIEAIHYVSKKEPDESKANLIGDFMPGDTMRYEAVSYDNGNVLTSAIITKAQYEDETIVLGFTVTYAEVHTLEVSNITQTSAVGGGEVTLSGGLPVIERGICWSTTHNPTVNENHNSNGNGIGAYSVNMYGLTQNTTYYVRAYATNGVGISYGQEMHFTTSQNISAPTVITSQVTNISQNTAIGGGNVTADGGANVTERGICWSSGHNPTINNSHSSNGSGLGSYTVNMTSLSAGTLYYVRAYAINSQGISYGQEVSFTTAAELPTVSTSQVSNITQTTATGGGNVTNDGGANVTVRGVCWSTNHNPTISDSHASNGTGTGNYSINITGLTANTTYYVRAYATNSVGTAYGSEVSFTTLQNVVLPTVTTSQVTDITQTTATGGGNVTADGGGTVTERGICWSVNHSPTISGNHASSGTGIGNYTVSMTNLTANTTYYVRAYATNSAGTAYGSEVNFTTLQNVTLPSVTTSQVTDITQTTATGGGNVTADGGGAVVERGICWSTNHNPTTSSSHSNNGTGTGSYTVGMTDLTANTIYYVRAYATNSAGTAYGSEVSFTTLQNVTLPSVITSQVTNITQTTATGGGNVTGDGGGTVTERGICWSTSHNPTMSGSHASNGTGTGNYTVSITGLTANTTYYVRAYATNSAGTAYGNEVSFTTSQIATYTITVSPDPSSGGSVSGGGTYQQGTSCTVSATANTNYTFNNWIENGIVVSTNASYTFTVESDRNLVANFTYVPPTYSINVSADPSSGGSVTGGGTYQQGISCSVTAMANNGYTFENWTENGSQVSTQASYTFIVTSDRTLVANFTYNAPTGAINGKYTINSSGSKVYFSQGNLQYQASTNTWRFAENQYNYVGNANSNISSTYNGWIDLFGWGTSGWNYGGNPNNCYHPWDTNENGNLYGTPSSFYDLTGSFANLDWGIYNPISNGGNQAGLWRTMTRQEWEYVFNTRITTSGIRYAKAKVNNINGVILLPDNWSTSTYNLHNTNNSGANFSNNILTASQWEILENSGAVFLPAAGNRVGTTVYQVGSLGCYWSVSCCNEYTNCAYGFFFNNSQLETDYDHRSSGFSVRLVCHAD